MSAATPSFHHARAVALMLLSTGCFTANILLVRAISALGFDNVWLVACARFIVGLVVIATIYRREWQPAHLLRNGRLIARGLAGGCGVYLAYLAITKVGAGRTTFINNTYVVWGALLAAWLLRERLRPVVLVGSVCALSGLALLTNVFSATVHPTIYDGAAVLSALVSAYVAVIIRQLHATEHSATIVSAQCFYGLILCSVPAVRDLPPVSGLVLALLLVAGVCTAAGQLALTRAYRDLPVAEGSLIQMLTPLGVAFGGAVFFHERFSPHEFAGAALILAGIAFTVLRRDRAKASFAS